MSEVDEAFLARKESLIRKIDYAYKIVNDITKNPDLVNLNDHNLENIRQMFVDIKEEVMRLV